MTPPERPSTMTRSTSGSHTSTRCSTTTSVARCASSTRRTASRTSVDPGGVEVGRRLVEQDDARAHREDAREREPLLLPAATAPRSAGRAAPRARRRRAPRAPAARSRSRGNAEVLAAERDVVADPREDRLAVGVLQHHARATAGPRGRLAVDQQLAGLLALVVAAEHAGEAVQQRRLARAGGAEQQHPLPRLDAERGVPHRPLQARGVAPPQPRASTPRAERRRIPSSRRAITCAHATAPARHAGGFAPRGEAVERPGRRESARERTTSRHRR